MFWSHERTYTKLYTFRIYTSTDTKSQSPEPSKAAPKLTLSLNHSK